MSTDKGAIWLAAFAAEMAKDTFQVDVEERLRDAVEAGDIAVRGDYQGVIVDREDTSKEYHVIVRCGCRHGHPKSAAECMRAKLPYGSRAFVRVEDTSKGMFGKALGARLILEKDC